MLAKDVFIYTHICTYISTNSYTHIIVQIYLYRYIYTCVCIYTYLYTGQGGWFQRADSSGCSHSVASFACQYAPVHRAQSGGGCRHLSRHLWQDLWQDLWRHLSQHLSQDLWQEGGVQGRQVCGSGCWHGYVDGFESEFVCDGMYLSVALSMRLWVALCVRASCTVYASLSRSVYGLSARAHLVTFTLIRIVPHVHACRHASVRVYVCICACVRVCMYFCLWMEMLTSNKPVLWQTRAMLCTSFNQIKARVLEIGDMLQFPHKRELYSHDERSACFDKGLCYWRVKGLCYWRVAIQMTPIIHAYHRNTHSRTSLKHTFMHIIETHRRWRWETPSNSLPASTNPPRSSAPKT